MVDPCYSTITKYAVESAMMGKGSYKALCKVPEYIHALRVWHDHGAVEADSVDELYIALEAEYWEKDPDFVARALEHYPNF